MTIDHEAMGRSATAAHVVAAGRDGGTRHGPTWKWECLTCGETEDGFIKERYAVTEGRNHEASKNASESTS